MINFWKVYRTTISAITNTFLHKIMQVYWFNVMGTSVCEILINEMDIMFACFYSNVLLSVKSKSFFPFSIIFLIKMVLW